MSWTKLDDRSAWHPKVLKVGNRGWGAFLRAVAWSALYRTSGAVPAQELRRIDADPRLWERILGAGLLDSLDMSPAGSAHIHDWRDYAIPGGHDAEKRREKASHAARARWGKDATEHAPSIATPNATAMPRARDPVQSRPVPSSPVQERDPERELAGDPTPSRPVERKGSQPSLLDIGETSKGEHQKVIAAFAKAFEEARGTKPQIGGREARAAKELREDLGVERALEVIRNAYSDPFGAKLDITQLAASPNRWLGVQNVAKLLRTEPLEDRTGYPTGPAPAPKIPTAAEMDADIAQLEAEELAWRNRHAG